MRVARGSSVAGLTPSGQGACWSWTWEKKRSGGQGRSGEMWRSHGLGVDEGADETEGGYEGLVEREDGVVEIREGGDGGHGREEELQAMTR
jgi:hypothetical protein